MSHLLREYAPITEASWGLIDDEARERLTPALAARKLVDFAGPLGWEHSATNLGRTQAVAAPPVEGVEAVQRRVLPLVELRVPFAVTRAELRDAQGEEFKHFCMDLEFLLRRTPLWREIAVGILFQEGDIVEHGEEAEEEAVEGAAARGAPVAGSASLGIGSLKGAGA